MLRFFRIIGIIVFAGLIGYTANSLWKMYEAGELLERYNNAPKANLTLLGFSVIALSTLGFFEVSCIRRLSQRRGYRKPRFREEIEKDEVACDSTSIYTTPQTKDVWSGHRTRRPGRKQQKQRREPGIIWMRLLQINSTVLLVIYLVLLSLNLMKGPEGAWVATLLPVALGVLLVLSLVVTVGIFRRTTWGMVLGYTLAVCNLLIFPYGTAAGLILIMELVGSTPIFEVSAESKRREKSLQKSKKRAQYSAV